MRGPHVFAGYHRDADATSETVRDGWLRSGDLGEIDADGFLRITGRKKDLIITSSGKNISPDEHRERAARDALDLAGGRLRRPALLPRRAAHARPRRGCRRSPPRLGIPADPALMARRRARPRGDLGRDVDAVNERFARIEQVKRFGILERDLSQADGELTPTLKVKRPLVYRALRRPLRRALRAHEDDNGAPGLGRGRRRRGRR